jgi:hypothetical protein
MSRSGYVDELGDIEQRDYAMWRGRVASAMRGKRGQEFLRKCLAALDAMPQKRLIADVLVHGDEVCTLGAAGKAMNIPGLEKLDPEEHEMLGLFFDVAPCLIQEIEFENDEVNRTSWIGDIRVEETPEKRFERMRKWLVDHIQA